MTYSIAVLSNRIAVKITIRGCTAGVTGESYDILVSDMMLVTLRKVMRKAYLGISVAV